MSGSLSHQPHYYWHAVCKREWSHWERWRLLMGPTIWVPIHWGSFMYIWYWMFNLPAIEMCLVPNMTLFLKENNWPVRGKLYIIVLLTWKGQIFVLPKRDKYWGYAFSQLLCWPSYHLIWGLKVWLIHWHEIPCNIVPNERNQLIAKGIWE